MGTKRTAARARRIAGAAVAAVLLAACAAFAAVVWVGINAPAEQAQAEPPLKREHNHSWQKDLELVHHEAVSHQVAHPAEVEDVMVPHTLCNLCGARIDGDTAAHAARTGHSAYTPDVPVSEQRIIAQGWVETVVDQEAFDELVAATETCTLCGQTRQVAGDE